MAARDRAIAKIVISEYRKIRADGRAFCTPGFVARDSRARIRILPLSGIIWVEPRLDPGSGISTAAVSNIVRSNIHGPLHP